MSSRLPDFMRPEGRTPGAGRHVRIATRGSALALAQAHQVEAHLLSLGATVEVVIVATQGDREQAPFSTMNGQGFFTKAVQDALLDGIADLAVHSHKDLPTAPVPDLEIAAVPTRAAAHDVLIMLPDAHNAQGALLPIRAGATIGTSAARRRHQLRQLRPDLVLTEMRGNVPTRIDRLREGSAPAQRRGTRCDALVLAAAGLERLGLELEDLVVVPLEPDVFLPAPAQGALALEIRRDDYLLAQLLTELHDNQAGRTVAAERGLMAMLDGGCQLALGAHAVLDGDIIRLRAYHEGARAEAEHATAEGAAMMVFEALGRPRGNARTAGGAEPARNGSVARVAGTAPGGTGDGRTAPGDTGDGRAAPGGTGDGRAAGADGVDPEGSV